MAKPTTDLNNENLTKFGEGVSWKSNLVYGYLRQCKLQVITAETASYSWIPSTCLLIGIFLFLNYSFETMMWLVSIYIYYNRVETGNCIQTGKTVAWRVTSRIRTVAESHGNMYRGIYSIGNEWTFSELGWFWVHDRHYNSSEQGKMGNFSKQTQLKPNMLVQ